MIMLASTCHLKNIEEKRKIFYLEFNPDEESI